MNVAPSASTRVDSPLKGISFMLLAGGLFVAMDSVAKYLGQYYPAPQLVWARYGIHLLAILVYLLLAGQLRSGFLASRAPLGQFLRGLLLLGTTMFAYLAVRELPLAQVYVVNFSAPVIVTLLAIPLLGETMGWRKMLAVVWGFLGVLVAISPGDMRIEPTLIFPVGMAICFALYQIATRRFGSQDPPITSLFYTAAVGGLASSLLVPFYWTPVAKVDIALFLVLGILGAASHFLLIMALRFAPASLVSPFLYSQFIWATIVGYIFFGDIVSLNTIIGAFLVIGSGLYLVVLERRSGYGKQGS